MNDYIHINKIAHTKYSGSLFFDKRHQILCTKELRCDFTDEIITTHGILILVGNKYVICSKNYYKDNFKKIKSFIMDFHHFYARYIIKYTSTIDLKEVSKVFVPERHRTQYSKILDTNDVRKLPGETIDKTKYADREQHLQELEYTKKDNLMIESKTSKRIEELDAPLTDDMFNLIAGAKIKED